MSYNNDEGIGDNHYNCPVVAYYPELLAANVPALKKTKFLDPYVGLWRHKDCAKRLSELFYTEFQIPKKETKAAVETAYDAYNAYVEDIHKTGEQYDRRRPGPRASPSSSWQADPITSIRRSTTVSTT